MSAHFNCFSYLTLSLAPSNSRMPVLRTRSASQGYVLPSSPLPQLFPHARRSSGRVLGPVRLSKTDRGDMTEPATPESPTLRVRANFRAKRQALRRQPSIIFAGTAIGNSISNVDEGAQGLPDVRSLSVIIRHPCIFLIDSSTVLWQDQDSSLIKLGKSPLGSILVCTFTYHLLLMLS
jgi:hypothetical protein